jgi:excisionase family DNA binding protein
VASGDSAGLSYCLLLPGGIRIAVQQGKGTAGGAPFRLLRFSFVSIIIEASNPEPDHAMTHAAILETTLPVEREVAAAVESQRALAGYLSTQLETQRIQIFDAKNQAHQVELPTSALRLLVDILSELAEGNAVKVVPIHAELTTQEAADMLNVSRPHLVKLLEGGALPFHKTGKHRRIRFADLMGFKAERDRASAQAMEELAKQAQELQLGYE